MNAVNVGLVTFIIQHNRIQGVFLLCKITNLLIYSFKNKIVNGDAFVVSWNDYGESPVPFILRSEYAYFGLE